MKIDAAIYKSPHNVILSEAMNLGSEMFREACPERARRAQHDKAIYEMDSNYAS